MIGQISNCYLFVGLLVGNPAHDELIVILILKFIEIQVAGIQVLRLRKSLSILIGKHFDVWATNLLGNKYSLYKKVNKINSYINNTTMILKQTKGSKRSP